MKYKIFLEKRATEQIGSIPAQDRKRIESALMNLKHFTAGSDVKKLIGLKNIDILMLSSR